jgi:hypothetical protein
MAQSEGQGACRSGAGGGQELLSGLFSLFSMIYVKLCKERDGEERKIGIRDRL